MKISYETKYGVSDLIVYRQKNSFDTQFGWIKYVELSCSGPGGKIKEVIYHIMDVPPGCSLDDVADCELVSEEDVYGLCVFRADQNFEKMLNSSTIESVKNRRVEE